MQVPLRVSTNTDKSALLYQAPACRALNCKGSYASAVPPIFNAFLLTKTGSPSCALIAMICSDSSHSIKQVLVHCRGRALCR